MPSNHLILCHPLFLLPSMFHSIRVFSNKSVFHIRWSKDQSFSFNISPSNKHSGLISFRMDWLDLLSVQGTLKNLLQNHIKSINFSVLSFLYSPILTSIHDYWKNHSFDYMNICQQSHVSALLISRFAQIFLPRSKCLFNFMVAVTICSDYGAQENKICHCFHFSPSCLP